METWQRNLAICWLGSFITVAGMTLVLPFLPLYLEELGVHSVSSVERWSGLAFGVTAVMAAIASPLWGRLADRYGRKLMLLRASLGMAVITALMGFVTEPWELVGLRFLMGAVSGYISASITLVATQTPKDRSGWALGVLSTGHVGGGLVGPLVGGYLAELMGLRHVFWVTGGTIFLCFILTWVLLTETFVPDERPPSSGREVWAAIPSQGQLVTVFFTSFVLQFGVMSIEPVVTVYVKQLVAEAGHIALLAGLVVSVTGLAYMLAAPWLGKQSDRLGAPRVLVASLAFGAAMLVPQAYVTNVWQLMALRFGFGLASAGMLPSINVMVRQLAPDRFAGRVFGYNQSALYLGSFAGPIVGGELAARYGIPAVFLGTALLLLLNAAWLGLQRDLSTVP